MSGGDPRTHTLPNTLLVGLRVASRRSFAYGGSRLGIGTDVAGSVRIPAHYSGIYAIKASTQRFPKSGNATSTVGQEGVPSVNSPMTRTLEDLETFWRAIIGMKPWEYDPSVRYQSLP